MQAAGPIVRINPWEVHIDDPEFFDQLYNTTLKLDKDPWYYRFADGHLSAFGTADADLHRMRRGALNRYFSTASIRLLDPLLEELFEKLSIRVEDHRRRRLPMPLGIAFRCFTADTVTEYSVPRAPTFLDARDYAKGYHASTRSFLKMAMWNRHFGFIIRVFSAFPRWFVAKVDPDEGLHAFDNLEVCHDSSVNSLTLAYDFAATQRTGFCDHSRWRSRSRLEAVSDRSEWHPQL